MKKYPTTEARGLLRQVLAPEADTQFKQGCVNQLLLQFSDMVDEMGIPGFTFHHVHMDKWDPLQTFWELKVQGKIPGYFHVDGLALEGPRFDTTRLVEMHKLPIEFEWDEDHDQPAWDSLSEMAKTIRLIAACMPDEVSDEG